jgi:TonB-linked SusC/RagA family outer membrane protein
MNGSSGMSTLPEESAMSLQSSPLARRILCAIGLLTLASPATAQGTGTIRGKVTDQNARPLSDVSVTVTGTTLGAITGATGDYMIVNVPAGQQQVQTRRLGYNRILRQVDVAAGATVTADFQLAITATKLQELVVTGTAGSVERRTVGNTITTVNVADLTNKTSISSVSEILQGKTPGVVFLPGSGAVGTAGEIRIRGVGSTNGYKPAVFIDGVRYNIDDVGGYAATGGGTAGLAQSTQVTSALNNLNPNDIESIEVIKGPAAATLYGAQAANGVIQIITKSGSRGSQQMRWTLRGEMGTSEYNLLPDDNYTFCDAAKQAATSVVGGVTVPTWPGCQGAAMLNQVIRDNPLKRDSRALRNGDVMKASISATGGGDRYNFYFAGDRDLEQGVFYNSDNARTSIRTNFGFNPSSKTDFGVRVNWSDGQLRLPIQDESANGILLSARRGQPGRISFFTNPADTGWRTITPTQANRYKNFTRAERMTISGTVNYTPFSWFRNRLTTGFDNTSTQAQLLFLPGDIDITQDPDAGSGANLRKIPERKVLTIDYGGTITYNPRSTLSTTTSFGSQVVADKSETLEARGIGIGAVDVTLVGLLQRTLGLESYSENNSVGYYIQEQVGWNDRLFVTGALRADDHSSFGSDFDIITYPKFSVSYIASDEPSIRRFTEMAKMTSLQLRAAWGQAGTAPNAYAADQTYTVDRVTLGTTTGSALRTSAFGNPDLKPERGTEIEVGFVAGFLADRLSADVTYYSKTTDDMLQSIPVAASTGFLGTRLTNLGTVTNKGIEIAINGMPIQRANLTWEANVSYATNANKLINFAVKDKVLETPGGQAYGVVQQHRPGYPLGGFWVIPPLRCGIDAAPTTAAPCPAGEVGTAMVTPAGAAIFNAGDTARRYFGTSMPTRTIGISNTVRLFKYARVYALLDHQGGHKVFNLQERNRCQAANDNCATVMDLAMRIPQGTTSADSIKFKELAVLRNASVPPQWIENGSFWKLREVSLSLDAPERFAAKARAQSASLVLSGRNLALWSPYSGVDPEVNSYGGRNFVRVDAYAMPMTRRLSAMINLVY